MRTIKSFFAGRHRKKESKLTRVECSGGGLVVWSDDGKDRSLDWSEVEKLFTYKVDCFAYDVIWLAFCVDGEEEIHIREEVEGFNQLIKCLRIAFPGIDPDWYQKVMLPAFAENLTLLYERPSANKHLDVPKRA